MATDSHHIQDFLNFIRKNKSFIRFLTVLIIESASKIKDVNANKTRTIFTELFILVIITTKLVFGTEYILPFRGVSDA